MILLSILGLLGLASPGNPQMSSAELHQRGEEALRRRDYSEMVEIYRPMAQMYKAGKTDTVMSQGFLYAGNAAFLTFQYIDALEYFTLGAKVAKETGKNNVYDACMNNVGNIYGVFGDYPRSAAYFTKAYENAVKEKNTYLTGIAAANLVRTMCAMDSLETAKKYFAIQRRHPESDSIRSQYNLLLSLGHIAMASDNPVGAAYYYRNASELASFHKMTASYSINADVLRSEAYVGKPKPESPLWPG